MNHQDIEDSDLVEAYVTDRLGEPARAEFEEHLVDCPECLDRVEAAQGLGAGLRALGSRGDPARAPRRRWYGGGAGWVLAASLTAVLALGWGVGERRRLERALESERAARAAAEARAQELTRRPPEPREPAALPRPVPHPPPPSRC